MKLPPLKFELYDRRLKYVSYRTSSGLQVRAKTKSRTGQLPKLSGGILKGEYVFDNVHFHCDSEHIIYGKSYALEAHFVHYRSSMGCIETAKASKMFGAIAIISVVYDIFRTTTPQWGPFDSLTCFTCSNEMEIDFCLRDLLPSYLRSYYSYNDRPSETNENIKWIIMAVPGIITDRQYDHFMAMCGKNMSPCEELETKVPKFIINGYLKDPKRQKRRESCPAVKTVSSDEGLTSSFSIAHISPCTSATSVELPEGLVYEL